MKTINKIKNISEEDNKREIRIVNRLLLDKLPFKISANKFCKMYLNMLNELKPLMKYKEGDYAMKWCLSNEKRMKVFLLIFEANELGSEIYKESISSHLPEYSYKTVAQIVDEGLKKNFFIKLLPRQKKTKDLKIRNIRPSEDLIVEFINWNIEIIYTLTKFIKKYK